MVDSFLKHETALVAAERAFNPRQHKDIPGIDLLKKITGKKSIYLLSQMKTALTAIADSLRILEGDQYPTLSLVQSLVYHLRMSLI
jgi:hypothetical protein